MEAFFDRLSARLRLPVWAVALLAVFLVDAVLAAGLVAAARLSAPAGAVSPSIPAPTERQLQDRFLMRSMDDVYAELGPSGHATVDNSGGIKVLRYSGMTVTVNGRVCSRGVSFFGAGNRCTFVGFDRLPGD